MAKKIEFEEPEEKPKDKKVLTIFLFMIPSLLLAMSSAIETLFVRLIFQIVLIFLQLVLLNNMLDDYYKASY
jgi:hypothetical protein